MTPPSLSGFEIIEELGTGGMATVWKARQVSLDRIVAIKILASGLSTDPDDVRRFQSEAQAAARLKHPGIVQVYDANVEDGTYYFVMEYVAGYTVGDWIRRKGRLSEKDALLARPMHWPMRGTTPPSSTAISSPTTSSLMPMARSRWPTSACPGRLAR